ncbi:MAG: TonB-dependent receptor plug domain-containing protein, partial [Deltaproteobacteria bacterium]|nr:TonB-dependent receptor plug domain-containing protein [Deltaproteobacteria bacterium]
EYRFHFELAPAPEPSLQSDGGVPDGALEARGQLRGRIVERGTRKPLPGAVIDIGDGALVLETDSEGRFETSAAPIGKVKIVALLGAYQRFETTETLEPGKATEVTYYLRRTLQGAFETVVVGEKDKKDVSVIAITRSEISRIPGVSGDAVRVVQNLPGMARTPFGAGQLVLRGSNPADSRVYIDGVEVPLIFHFTGLSSAYSPDLTREVEYEPGNYGIQYGRATGGRVEVKTRDPDPKSHHLLFDFNASQVTLLGEGPLTDTLSFAVAARRSYSDLMLSLGTKMMEWSGESTDDLPQFSVAPRFYDFQAKLTWLPSKHDAVRLGFYGSDDAMGLAGIRSNATDSFDSVDLTTRFFRLVGSWDHRPDPATRLRLLVAGGYDKSAVNLDTALRMEQVDWSTTIRAEGFHDFGSWLTLGLGFDGRYDHLLADYLTPPIPQANEMPNSLDQRKIRLSKTFKSWTPGAWLEAVVRPFKGLSLVPGLRVDHGSYYGQTWLDPRLNARWTVIDGTTVKGGAGVFHQFPNGAYVTEEYGNPDLGPEAARQYSLGVEQRIWGPLSVDVQGYYKQLYDLVEPSTRRVERGGSLVAERYGNDGTGRAWGAELLLRYDADGRFFGWIAYSYSRTQRDSKSIGGRLDETGDAYDQPHNLIAVGTLELPEVWDGLSVGLRLRYGSGSPYRKNDGAIYDVDGDYYSAVPAEKMNARLPDFFQLDLRVDKKWTFRTSTLSAYLDVQNVTYRQNASMVFYNFDYSQSAYVGDLPIYPSVGLKFVY